MTSGGNNFNYSPENQLTKFGALSPLNNNGIWGPKSLLNELASAIWRLIDENISDQLPKLYLFDSLNRRMCGAIWAPTRFLWESTSRQTFSWIL